MYTTAVLSSILYINLFQSKTLECTVKTCDWIADQLHLKLLILIADQDNVTSSNKNRTDLITPRSGNCRIQSGIF